MHVATDRVNSIKPNHLGRQGASFKDMDASPRTGLRIVTHNRCRGGSTGDGNSWQRLLSDIDADIICAQPTRRDGSAA